MQARQAGIPVIGEIELAARYLKGHIVAITGSNGKTTTTTLAGEIIAAGGTHTLVGGNIGTPAISFVGSRPTIPGSFSKSAAFSLETIETFHPAIAVVLNVTPDHLDRHHTFENYAAAKARIFENQTSATSPCSTPTTPPAPLWPTKTKASIHWFSRQHEVERGAFVQR